MAERMTLLKQKVIHLPLRTSTNLTVQRAVKQAMREMLLAHASDWPFLMQKGRAQKYAEGRVMKHAKNFDTLFSMIMDGDVEDDVLRSMEESNRIFYYTLPSDNRLSYGYDFR